MDEQMIDRLHEWHDEAVELGYCEMCVPTEWITAARAAHSVMAARLAKLEEALDMLCDSVEREDELNGSISGALMADVREARAALAPHPKGTDQL